MFDKDVSQLAKPSIKGRGFIGVQNQIVETQTYYTIPERFKNSVALYKPIELLEQYSSNEYVPKAV